MTSAFFGLPDESLKTKKAQATILLMLPYIYKCVFLSEQNAMQIFIYA